MKKYQFIQLTEGEETEYVVMTEDEILEEYWEFWSRKMIEKYGEDHEFITSENCIEDWIVTHWATEVK